MNRVKPRSISFREVYKKMDNGLWQLPNIQRDFVWKFAKQKHLFVSIFKGQPIGGLLLWPVRNTKTCPHVDFQIENGWKPSKKQKPEFLVLDGQQRLTTLFIQKYFESRQRSTWKSSEIDGRTYKVLVLDFNKFDKDKPETMFHFVAPSRLHDDPAGKHYIEVPCLLHDSSRKAEEQIEKLKLHKYRKIAKGFRERLLDAEVTVDYLREKSTLAEGIEAFTNVNNTGTKLGVVDLAAIKLFEVSKSFKKTLRSLVVSFEENGFSTLNRTSVINSVLFQLLGTADPAKASKLAKAGGMKVSEKSVDREMNRVSAGYRNLKKFLEDELHFKSGSGLSSMNLMVAAQCFISRDKRNSRLTEIDRHRLKHWFFITSICNPFTGGSTRAKVDASLKLMADPGVPFQKLLSDIDTPELSKASFLLSRQAFESYDGDPVKPGKALKHLLFLASHYEGAVDWFSHKKVNLSGMRSTELDWDLHHIFPPGNDKVKCGVKDRSKLEHIGNLTWITQATNRGAIKHRAPEDYLDFVLKSGGKLLETHFVPVDKKLWKVSSFDDFVKARSKCLLRSLNRVLDSWKKGVEPVPKKIQIMEEDDAESVISKHGLGESQRLEFKETFGIDTSTGKKNWSIEQSAVRAVAAFANTGGGYLIIGVRDKPCEVVGVDPDVQYFEVEKEHELEQVFRQAVNKRLRPKLDYPTMEVTKDNLKGKEVLFVKVRSASDVIVMKYETEAKGGRKKEEVVWSRDGNSTIRLG